MKYCIILFVFIMIANDCIAKKVPRFIREKFTNCYSPNKTGINTLIDIHGYYVLIELGRFCSGSGTNEICTDSSEVNMMFFEDGTFLYNFFDRNNPYPGNTGDYLKRVTEGEGTDLFYKGFYWGIYRIMGDTIIAQYISNSVLLAPWVAWEERFKVINRGCIELIINESHSLNQTTKQEKRFIRETNAKRKFIPAKYVYSPYVPKPDSWLKKEAWTKCK